MAEYNFQADITKFALNTNSYNGENSLFLADCAKLTYESEAIIKQVMQEQLNFHNFRFFDGKKSTQAFVAGNDKNIIVAFRGTQKKIRDFLADAKLKLQKGPVGEVH